MFSNKTRCCAPTVAPWRYDVAAKDSCQQHCTPDVGRRGDETHAREQPPTGLPNSPTAQLSMTDDEIIS